MTDSSIKSGSEMSPASPFAWKPLRWIDLCARGLQTLVIYTGTIAAVIGCINLVDQFNGKLSFLGLLLLPVFVFAAVVIHEGGHWLAARAAGMTVYFAWVGPLQLKPLRRGMRIRWLWPKPKIHGAVMAFPDPHRPIRGQLMLMSVGGPGANLLAALVFGAIGVAFIFSPAALPLIGFAILNFAMAIGNILPTEQHMASDGLTILRSLRVRYEKDIPELIFMRLNGMAIRGMTVDEMPQADIAKLEGMAMPMPLIHLWYRIKRYQHSAEWEQAAALESRFDELVAELPDGWKPQLADFVANLRCELRFCRAMAGLPLEQPIDDGLTDELDWFSPTLRPRCQALSAIREGNLDVARVRLAESERWASRSIDLALERSEANLRRAMLAELGAA